MPRKCIYACFFFVLFFFSSASIRSIGTSAPLAHAAEEGSTVQIKSGSSHGEPVTTRHTIKIAGEVVDYTATAGFLPIEDSTGKLQAEIFFIAYVKQGTESEKRPLTFAFNGGPGASSIWLNLGGIGPKRAQTAELKPSPPPYSLRDNPHSWIRFTDLVFIDPVGTGFSRPAPGISEKDFYGIERDVQSVGELIRSYTSKYGRWLSPKFLAGESYGALRAVELTEHLHLNCGMDLNGIILVSPALDFQTLSFQPGNDLPYLLFLPSYTATAFFHKRLPAELQRDFQKTLEEVEAWAMGEYVQILVKGDAVGDEEKSKAAERLARYTGLSEEFVKRENLRIQRSDFLTELLKETESVVGLMDGRAVGEGSSVSFYNDPSMLVTIGSYVACMNDYLQSDLKYVSNLPYVYLSESANNQWNYGSASNGYVSAVKSLRTAVAKRGLKVFAACGLFDLDIPYLASKYTLEHLGISGDFKDNITLRNYEAGHMLYVSESSLEKLTADVFGFIRSSVPAK